MRYLLLACVVSFFFFTNCNKTYYVNYDEESKDMITTDKLKTYLDETENPDIVLRVPNSIENPTESSSSIYKPFYTTIEKELLRAGFNVRDRALFNQILSQSSDGTNYAELQSTTETDLILELVDISTEVEFTTNTYYESTEFDEKKTFDNDYSLTLYGGKVEFKVVLIKDNQFAGSYVFYYEPCPNGCPIGLDQNTGEPHFKNMDEKNDEEDEDERNPFQYVSRDAFEEFIKNATQELITEMKEGN